MEYLLSFAWTKLQVALNLTHQAYVSDWHFSQLAVQYTGEISSSPPQVQASKSVSQVYRRRISSRDSSRTCIACHSRFGAPWHRLDSRRPPPEHSPDVAPIYPVLRISDDLGEAAVVNRTPLYFPVHALLIRRLDLFNRLSIVLTIN